MVETALDLDIGPYLSEGPHDLNMAVHRHTEGIKALVFKLLEQRVNNVISLFIHVGIKDDLLAQGIHHDELAAFLVEVSTVKEKILVLRVTEGFMGLLIKPIIFDAFELISAVSGQTTELTDRIALFNPKLKPALLFTLFA